MAEHGHRPAPSARRPTRAIFATTVATAALTHMDATMVAVALPGIRQGLGADDAQLHAVVTAYLLAFGLVLLLAGRLGDVFGRRSVCLIGQSLFLLGAVAAALAPVAEVLVVARGLQGVGAGLLLPQGSALIQTLFEPVRRGRAFAAVGVAIAAATTIGPVLAGILLWAVPGPEAWRWLFLSYVPISPVLLLSMARLYPGAPARVPGGRRVDLLGALLAATAVTALLFPLLAQADMPLGQRPWYTLPIGLLAAALLAWHVRSGARRGRPTIVDPALRRTRGYLTGVLVASLYFAGFTAVPVVLSLVLQEGRGLTPLGAGLLMAPWAVGNGLSAPIGGRWVVRRGRRVAATGALVSTVAIAAIAASVAWVGVEALPWMLMPAMLLGGIGAGLTIGPNLTITLRHVSPLRAGGAAALQQTGQRVGSAAGTAAAMGVLLAVLDLGHDVAGSLALGLSGAFVAASAVVAVTDVVRHRHLSTEPATASS